MKSVDNIKYISKNKQGKTIKIKNKQVKTEGKRILKKHTSNFETKT